MTPIGSTSSNIRRAIEFMVESSTHPSVSPSVEDLFDEGSYGASGMGVGADDADNEDAVDQDENLLGRPRGIGVCEIREFIFEECAKAFGVRARDFVRGVVRVGEREFGGDVAAPSEAGGRCRLVELVED